MIYTLIPICLILFFKWQLEKHENKYLIRRIIFLEALKEVKKMDLSGEGWNDADQI